MDSLNKIHALAESIIRDDAECELEQAGFAGKIRAERMRLNLSQAECATLLSVSPRTVWSWEQRKAFPSKIEESGALSILGKTKAKK